MLTCVIHMRPYSYTLGYKKVQQQQPSYYGAGGFRTIERYSREASFGHFERCQTINALYRTLGKHPTLQSLQACSLKRTVTFDVATGEDILATDPARTCAPFTFEYEVAPGKTFDASSRSPYVSMSMPGPTFLLRAAAGLDAHALAEEDYEKSEQQRREREKRKPKYMKNPFTVCRCWPRAGVQSGDCIGSANCPASKAPAAHYHKHFGEDYAWGKEKLKDGSGTRRCRCTRTRT